MISCIFYIFFDKLEETSEVDLYVNHDICKEMVYEVAKVE